MAHLTEAPFTKVRDVDLAKGDHRLVDKIIQNFFFDFASGGQTKHGKDVTSEIMPGTTKSFLTNLMINRIFIKMFLLWLLITLSISRILNFKVACFSLSSHIIS